MFDEFDPKRRSDENEYLQEYWIFPLNSELISLKSIISQAILKRILSIREIRPDGRCNFDQKLLALGNIVLHSFRKILSKLSFIDNALFHHKLIHDKSSWG